MMALFDLLPPLLSGLLVTVQVFCGATVVVLVLSLVAGLARLSRWRVVRWLAVAYIEIFRGTSALVQLFWLYYVLPVLGVELSALMAGILALGLNYGAYGAELFRAAVMNIPRGQAEAGIALNMSRWQRMRHILLPQAMVRMLPPAGNLQIELLKNTALVYFISLHDLTFQGKLLQTATQRTVEIFGLILVLYFILALLIMLIVRGLERWLGRGLRAGMAVKGAV
jgi:polar amino acid transport system permease protein